MSEFRGLAEPHGRSKAGVIRRIRLENFMCHSNLEIELGEYVNFITGQNGSGKSAILTALCVAFGCKAKGTQRASTLKDFVKTGCSSAVIQVELKNQGEDAFKPEIYGDLITIERRIFESRSSMSLKDCQGKKVATRKDELLELVEHFNIDVENPCVIMSQDKSREFLHSGNDKDKFKFFFKATLLQRVNDLLQDIREHLEAANALIDELEASIAPIVKELNDLQGRIKNMERLEEISHQVQQLKKKLAWAWVYDLDRQLKEKDSLIEKLKSRIPACQARIDEQIKNLENLQHCLGHKRNEIEKLMIKTSEVKRKKNELQQLLSLAKRERQELAQEHARETKNFQRMTKHVRLLQQQIQEIQEQHIKNTQSEEDEIEAKVRELEHEIDLANSTLTRLKDEENALSENINMQRDEFQKIAAEIEEFERKHREACSNIHDLHRHQTNKVTAFGGDRVIQLLRAIERHQSNFSKPPIGPIGAHLTLVNGDTWAPAVENAIGKLLNAFIATNHRDSLALRKCARGVNYHNLQIIIYDFSRPRLNIPNHMLPQTTHPTALSVLQSENATVINVLVDLGSVERQVLVRDYDVGKSVAFDQRISNLKEVHTLDGYKMFSRGGVQTVLPPNRGARTHRLCSSFDDQIENLEREAHTAREQADEGRRKKRDADSILNDLQGELHSLKRRCMNGEKDLLSKQFALQELKNSHTATSLPTSNVDELHQEISKAQDGIKEKEAIVEKISVKMDKVEEKGHELKQSFEDICESAKGELGALEVAEKELMEIENHMRSAEAEKAHYEGIMSNKVLNDIKVAEAQYRELEGIHKEYCRKASIICPEGEIKALGEWDQSTPEHLSAQLSRLSQRLQQESQKYSESLDDLRAIYEKKQHMISRKQETYKTFREKLLACRNALDTRFSKLQRNATLLKRQLTWQFNGHLRKKGISGHIKVSYEEKTLVVEVKMPQDASSSTVRDTRGLSGGERSFSTLCFALALHEMTEAPFRAMDEFDVFMDAVSRKISLDTLVDFALAQGSQWIFITPHDIGMVKTGERIKKQQMAAPRN